MLLTVVEVVVAEMSVMPVASNCLAKRPDVAMVEILQFYSSYAVNRITRTSWLVYRFGYERERERERK